MIKKGRRIYYDRSTGNVIWEIGEQTYYFDAIDETIDQDIATFKALSDRNRDTFDVIELPFGAYDQDFAECNGYRVKPETKQLEFSYPDPNAPEEPQPFQAPLSQKVEALEQRISQTDEVVLTLLESMYL